MALIGSAAPTRAAREYSAPYPERLVRQLPGHFDATQRLEYAVWTRRSDNGVNVLRVVCQDGGEWRTLARGYHAAVYDLQVGDVEGSGRDDIVVGLTQRAKLDVVPRPRIHVYAVDAGRGFRPLWRGSSLSYPFRAFQVWSVHDAAGAPKPARIVAVERNPLADYSDFEWLSVYRWNGFGFIIDWQTPVRGKVTDVRLTQTPSPGVTYTQDNFGVQRTIRVLPDPWRAELVKPATNKSAS